MTTILEIIGSGTAIAGLLVIVVGVINWIVDDKRRKK